MRPLESIDLIFLRRVRKAGSTTFYRAIIKFFGSVKTASTTPQGPGGGSLKVRHGANLKAAFLKGTASLSAVANSTGGDDGGGGGGDDKSQDEGEGEEEEEEEEGKGGEDEPQGPTVARPIDMQADEQYPTIHVQADEQYPMNGNCILDRPP